MRQYMCVCLNCKEKVQLAFPAEPYPEYGDVFRRVCRNCGQESDFTRALTRKTASEIRKKQEESALRESISAQCAKHGFRCRFLYQSVIITTPLSDWCFDYHQPRITLYHESTTKINFNTGDYAKAHVQFRDRALSPTAVIDYIAAHESWRLRQK